MKRTLFVAIGVLLCVSVGVAAQESPQPACDVSKSAWCVAPKLQQELDVVGGATVPKLATPAWLAPQPSVSRVVEYSVTTRGSIRADMDEFRSFVSATLNDSRGWTRLGVSFREVESGGSFVVYMSEASQMTSFSELGCDATYSCNVGNAVIINQDRWFSPTPSWTNAGGDLSSYRQMVMNHETGHWLGHGHRFCSGAGQPAPVMQQQSMDMQGCAPNSWPLSGEMYSPTLGIRS